MSNSMNCTWLIKSCNIQVQKNIVQIDSDYQLNELYLINLIMYKQGTLRGVGVEVYIFFRVSYCYIENDTVLRQGPDLPGNKMEH